MEKITLKATTREESGKSVCKHLRREGRIPAVVYKDGKKGINLHVDNKELWHTLHTGAGENAIITMEIDAEGKHSTKTVIVKDVQVDPVNDRFIHVDFCEISLTEKLKVQVPITLKGEAVGVLEEKGVMTQGVWELEVECLPTAIPAHLDVNVSELKLGDAIHVKDIKIPEGVKVLDDPEQVVVSVTLPKEEEEEVTAEGAEAEGAEEPEVIKKGKKEEELEEGAEEERKEKEGE